MSFVRDVINRLEIGNWIAIDRRSFCEAYPCGWPSIYRTHEQAFLSSAIGSAWGCWTVMYDFVNDRYIVARHKAGTKLVYVDPDREHLFTRQPDGTLVRK